MIVRAYMPPRRSAFVAARPSGFVNPLDPFGLLTGGPFGAPSLTSAPAVDGWGSAPGDGYGAGPGPSTPVPASPPVVTQAPVPPRVPAPQQPAMAPAQSAPVQQPALAPAPAADTGLSTTSMLLLGTLAVGGIAGAAYYLTRKPKR